METKNIIRHALFMLIHRMVVLKKETNLERRNDINIKFMLHITDLSVKSIRYLIE